MELAERVTLVELREFKDFKLSIRGKLNEKKIKEKIKDKEIPLIIDLSINGYSKKDTFNLEVEGVTFEDFKSNCKKNADTAEDLTIKRACRVCRHETHKYITDHQIETPLFRKYSSNIKNIELVKNFCFIGGEHLANEEELNILIEIWQNFDREKRTNIADTLMKLKRAKFKKL